MSDLLERIRSFELDHEPKGWPAVQMRDISSLCDLVERAEAKVDLFRRACEGLLDDRPIERAFILRKQAEAVEAIANKLEGMNLMRPDEFLRSNAQRLRQQANKAERAGGEK